MFLSDNEITKLIIEQGAVENYDVNSQGKIEGLGAISYDLHTKEIIIVSNEDPHHKSCETYQLNPGSTVFISTIENVNMPNDCIGMITPRNSRIRIGLQISAPVYHPGHHTKIFIRVSNISDECIVLKAGESIASIMFGKLSSPTSAPYRGAFVDEFKYSGVSNYSTDGLPEIVQVKKKIKSIEKLERNIYGNVIVLMTIFIGIFSLININVDFLAKGVIDLKTMLVYNLVSIGTIGILIALITLVIPNKKNRRGTTIALFAIPIILLVSSFLAYVLI